MANGIAGADAPMNPVGALLAQGGGAPAAGGPSPDQQLQGFVEVIMPARQLVQQIAAQYPPLAPQVEPIIAALEELVPAFAQVVGTQGPSGTAVPGGGGVG